jgi:hypothetical protein
MREDALDQRRLFDRSDDPQPGAAASARNAGAAALPAG